jgi:hypothetical protein
LIVFSKKCNSLPQSQRNEDGNNSSAMSAHSPLGDSNPSTNACRKMVKNTYGLSVGTTRSQGSELRITRGWKRGRVLTHDNRKTRVAPFPAAKESVECSIFQPDPKFPRPSPGVCLSLKSTCCLSRLADPCFPR